MNSEVPPHSFPRTTFLDSFRVDDYPGVDTIFVNTRAFVGTNPTAEPVTSGLPAILTQWGALRDVCGAAM